MYIICTDIYIYIYIYIYTYMYRFLRRIKTLIVKTTIPIHTCMYAVVYTHIPIYIHICIFIYTCIYECI